MQSASVARVMKKGQWPQRHRGTERKRKVPADARGYTRIGIHQKLQIENWSLGFSSA